MVENIFIFHFVLQKLDYLLIRQNISRWKTPIIISVYQTIQNVVKPLNFSEHIINIIIYFSIF